MSALVESYRAHISAYTLTRDVITIVKQTIAAGGPPEQIRALDGQLLDLDERSRQLWGRAMAIRARQITPPTPEPGDVAALGSLLEETERLRRRSVAASQALQIGSRALALSQSFA